MSHSENQPTNQAGIGATKTQTENGIFCQTRCGVGFRARQQAQHGLTTFGKASVPATWKSCAYEHRIPSRGARKVGTRSATTPPRRLHLEISPSRHYRREQPSWGIMPVIERGETLLVRIRFQLEPRLRWPFLNGNLSLHGCSVIIVRYRLTRSARCADFPKPFFVEKRIKAGLPNSG